MKTGPKIAISAILALACCALGSCVSLGIPPRNNDVEPRDISLVPDGTYVGVGRVTPPFGTAAVFRSITAKVTVVGGKLAAIEVVKPKAVSEPIADLPARMIAANGADVDVISGATWSSKALAKAVDDALERQKAAK